LFASLSDDGCQVNRGAGNIPAPVDDHPGLEEIAGLMVFRLYALGRRMMFPPPGSRYPGSPGSRRL
jgi:hypothetical protein